MYSVILESGFVLFEVSTQATHSGMLQYATAAGCSGEQRAHRDAQILCASDSPSWGSKKGRNVLDHLSDWDSLSWDQLFRGTRRSVLSM